MSRLLVLPFAAPLLTAALLLAVPRRRSAHRSAGLAVTAGVLVLAVALLVVTRDGTVLVERVGGWRPLVAIGFAADALSALMVTVCAVVVLACLAASGHEHDPLLVPLVLVLSAGAYGAFLTTDLFNLFVLVEVMLVPSYVLIALGGGSTRLGAARVYVATNLLASTILLAGVGLVYGVTGTVRLADLAAVARDSPTAAVAAGVVLLALAVKSAVVPWHDWLPRTYPEAPPVVLALFSGLLTKVGLYALIRIYAVVYDGDAAYGRVIAAVALLSMVVGVLGALGEATMRRVLTFHMVSQIGYVLLGLALFTAASLSAAVFYLVQYILVKTALFLCAAAVHAGHRTDRLDRLTGLSGIHPVLALAFAGAALSLAGLPPFSGFVAKFLLIRAVGDAGQWVAVAVAVGVSLLTLASMLKIWGTAFWGEPPAPDEAVATRPPARMVLPALTLAVGSLLLGALAEPLLGLADAAAAGLLDLDGYLRAVSGR
ncbi:monovalent cation/H+ antiporter subunit D family protein [Micromonospora echinofusca]|uniref:monovalent cation/H+ antiporter subunit D family protein n=1 Tax=Micromonospora echinofusca TaxID=47858 RepID=UPI0020226B3B|nr:monovalent cation/H+ antiporter subunit D family protein [Micromonospora sp. MSM11]MCL7455602.1 monovalent cation/H+ antiporter subunit D family protein [Micromonospora sp. MSM11]